MQIVIDISEENYRKVEDGRCPVSVMREAIGNGMPLPKGHGKLIDADELKYKINSFDNDVMGEDWYALYDNVMSDIDSAPTIIKADAERDKE